MVILREGLRFNTSPLHRVEVAHEIRSRALGVVISSMEEKELFQRITLLSF